MRLDILGALQAQDVGMAADGARGRAGRVEQHHVEGAPRRPARRVGLHDLGRELQARQVLAQAIEPRGRHIDRRDVGPGRGERRRLAAGRGAQVGDRCGPATSPATRATSAAAASCTHQAPSA